MLKGELYIRTGVGSVTDPTSACQVQQHINLQEQDRGEEKISCLIKSNINLEI